MKFPRNARIFQARLDAAPFAAVFFLLVLFLMLSSLIYTPGVPVPIDQPAARDLPGTKKAVVAVAIDANGRLFFENRSIAEADLRVHLLRAVKNSHEPLDLVVHADKAVTYERLVRLYLLARDAGIHQEFLATLPRPEPTLTEPGPK